MSRIVFASLMLFFGLVAHQVQSQTSENFAVLVRTTLKTTAPYSITLSWARQPLARNYVVARRSSDFEQWQQLGAFGADVLEFTDTDVERGVRYEYRITHSGNVPNPRPLQGANPPDTIRSFVGFTYISAGIGIETGPTRGTLLLAVEESLSQSLKTEIDRLVNDLTRELWNVKLRTFPRTNSFNKERVAEIKEWIFTEYDAQPDSVTHVFLLGRLAVPYSGNFAPDAHIPDHQGAWPADVYYGDMDGRYTDNINSVGAAREENKNAPDDGKFDQNTLATDAELCVGRVDFSNMPLFDTNEVNLYRRYLEKNHLFRTGRNRAPFRALVSDNFGGFPEVFGSSGWRTGSALVGRDVVSRPWLGNVTREQYMWAYGCGGGSYTHATGVANSDSLANNSIFAPFTMLFGSYFGDWDSRNNFLRGPLAAEGWALTAAWAGRPGWHFHRMGVGGTIGEAARLSQNNRIGEYSANAYLTDRIQAGATFENSQRGMHIALMGDPTLRIQSVETGTTFVPAPQQIALGLITNGVQVTWLPPDGNRVGSNIYRSDDGYNWTKLNASPIQGNTFEDKSVERRTYSYAVRTVQERSTATALLLEESAAVEASVVVTSTDEMARNPVSLWPNPAKSHVTVRLDNPVTGRVTAEVFDALGNWTATVADADFLDGQSEIIWDLRQIDGRRVPAGFYVLRVRTGTSVLSQTFVVLDPEG